MRILAIRGENLASLGEPFEVNLETDPLRGAGLFAITGETGAGKSTILDALCLALYADFPRIAAEGANENVPDIVGKTIAAKDARTILRKGASAAFAEVDFEAVDGARYRVTWRVYRARAKATGNMQKPERLLLRLNGEGPPEAIAASVTSVSENILRLTDFTFDQFCRTVLLAQGDFDAFLRANDNERACLLEKITGTEVYALISRRVHDMTGTARSALELLQARQREIGLLDSSAREMLATRQVEHRAAMTAAAGELAGIVAQKQRHEAIAAAQAKQRHAEQTLATAQAASDAAAPDRERMAALDSAEAFRPLFVALREREAAVAKANDALESAEAKLAKSVEAAAGATQTAATANAGDAAAQTFARDCEPLWAVAADLDTQIRSARDEAATAAGEAAARKTDCEATAAQWEAAAQKLREVTDLAAALARRSDGKPGLDIVSARLDEIQGELDKRGALRLRRDDSLNRRDAALAEQTAQAARIAAADDAAAADAGRQSDLASQIESRRAAFDGVDEEALLRRRQALADALTHQGEAVRSVSGHAAATARDAAAKTLATAAGTALTLARASHETAVRDGQAAQAGRDALQSGLDLADAIEKAVAFRADLHEGDPCPVCGGREHPFAHDDAAQAHVEAIRARRRALDDEASACRKRRDAAARAAMEAEAQMKRSGENARESQAAMADCARDFAEALRELGLCAGPAGLSVPAMTDVATAAAPLQALVLAIGTGRERTVQAVRAAAQLRGDLDRLMQLAGKLATAQARRAHERRSQEETRARAELEAHEQDTLHGGSIERLASIDRELAPHLARLGMTAADIDCDSAAAGRFIAREVAAYRKIVADVAQAELRRQELVRQVADLDILAKARADVASDAADIAAKRQSEHAALQTRRAPLFGGEATPAHRLRILGARDIAAAAAAAAARVLQMAEMTNAGTAASRDAARYARDAAALALAGAIAARAEALADGDRSPHEVAALLAIPVLERRNLRDALAAMQHALVQAAATLEARADDLAAALAGGVAEATFEALALLEAEAAARQETARDFLATLANQLAADDAARKKAGALEAEIAVARENHEVHAAVNAAIGSADGNKFSRFAQSLTLDHLLALANTHLRNLAPRYALARAGAGSLGLQVIDRDMGDEIRSTRTLSGGERFLASLALALALSGLEGRRSFVDTLFIDEGFGTLDAETLDMAIAALEQLHGMGRKVGVISHVAAMHDRIPVQVRVEKCGQGRSRVIAGNGFGE